MAASVIDIEVFSPASTSTRAQDLKELADRCQDMVDAARIVTARWAAQWNKALSYLYDDQLAEKKREDGWQAVQINQIFPVIKQEIAILAQRKHRMAPKAWRPSDADEVRKAEFWKGHLQWRHDKTLRMEPFKWRALIDGKLNGWMIAKVTADDHAWWDDDRKHWVYEPRVDLVDPKHFGIDPNCERPEDARYMFHEYQLTVEEAVERWPKKRKLLESAASSDIEEYEDLTQIPAVAEQMKGTDERDKGENSTRGGDIVSLLKNARREAQRRLEPGQEGFGHNQRYVTVREVYFKDSGTKKVKDYADWPVKDLLEQGAVSPIYAPMPEPEVNPDTGEPVIPTDPATGMPLPPPEPVVIGYQVANQMHEAFEGSSLKDGQKINPIDWPERVVSEYEMPKFPHGRCVFMVNDKVMNDTEEEQRWNRVEWPFVIGYNMLLPHVPQGLDSVSLLMHAQDLINFTWANIVDWLVGFCRSKTVAEKGALAPGQDHKIKALRIIEVIKGSIDKVRNEPGTELGAGLVSVFQMMVRQVQDLGGQHDPTLGGVGRNTEQTATAITVAQQATQVGMGMQILLLDDWVQRIMEQVAELDRQNLEAGDQLRIVADADKDSVAEWSDEVKDLKFDLSLDVGVSLPYDQERQKIDAGALLKGFGGLPKAKEHLLDAYEVADKGAWLAQDQEYQAFLAYQQMVAEQAKLAEQNGPGPAPAQAPDAAAAVPAA